MSFRPAGAEESDSDDEGFYMGSIHDNNMNGGFANKSNNTASRKNFVAMPAGAESDDEDSDGFEFNSVPVNSQTSTPAKVSGSQTANDNRQYLFAKNEVTSNSLPDKSGPGRGRGLLPQRGRGRGGFPRPPLSYNINKGKTTRRLLCFHTDFVKEYFFCIPNLRTINVLFLGKIRTSPMEGSLVWDPYPSWGVVNGL